MAAMTSFPTSLEQDLLQTEFPSGIFGTEDLLNTVFKTQDDSHFPIEAESNIDYALRRMSDSSVASTSSNASSVSLESFEIDYLNLPEDLSYLPTSSGQQSHHPTLPNINPPESDHFRTMAGFTPSSSSSAPIPGHFELGPPRGDEDFREMVYGSGAFGTPAASLALPYISGRRASLPNFPTHDNHGQGAMHVPNTAGIQPTTVLAPPDISTYQFPRAAFPSPPMHAGMVSSPPPPSTAGSTSSTFSLGSPPSTASSFSVAPVQSSPATLAMPLPAMTPEYANIFVRGEDGAYRLQRIPSRPHAQQAHPHGQGVYSRVISGIPRAFPGVSAQGYPTAGYNTFAHLSSPPILPLHRGGAKRLPSATKEFLKSWLFAHADHPYPTEEEKQELCAVTGMSMPQLSNWMINARRRILAPAKLAGKLPSKHSVGSGGSSSPPITVQIQPQSLSTVSPLAGGLAAGGTLGLASSPPMSVMSAYMQNRTSLHGVAGLIDSGSRPRSSGETGHGLDSSLDNLLLATLDEGDDGLSSA